MVWHSRAVGRTDVLHNNVGVSLDVEIASCQHVNPNSHIGPHVASPSTSCQILVDEGMKNRAEHRSLLVILPGLPSLATSQPDHVRTQPPCLPRALATNAGAGRRRWRSTS